MTADGKEVNQRNRAVPGARSSGHYMKYAVHLRGHLDRPVGPLPGQVLQLTPTAARLPGRMGDSITLVALFQGKPLAGAQVVTDFVNDPEAPPMRTEEMDW